MQSATTPNDANRFRVLRNPLQLRAIVSKRREKARAGEDLKSHAY
jgi:hypothetical protein